MRPPPATITPLPSPTQFTDPSHLIVIGSDPISTRGDSAADLMSFYSLPSNIIGNDKHKELRAAFSYYNIANSVDILDLVQDALICARNAGFDVFNALDIMENAQVSGSAVVVLWFCLFGVVC